MIFILNNIAWMIVSFIKYLSLSHKVCYRKCTFTRRLYKLWSTRFHRQLLTTLCYGQQRLQPTVTSVKACFGVLQGKELGARNAGSSVMRNAKICSTRIVYRVSVALSVFFSLKYLVIGLLTNMSPKQSL